MLEHQWSPTLPQRLCDAKAYVFDFYGTLVEDDVSVPPMWQQLNELGYNSGAELQAIFEPDGFDGCTTPDIRSDPSHDEWNLGNLRRFVRLSGVPDELLECTLSKLLISQATFRVKSTPKALDILTLLRLHEVALGLCSNWESPIGPYLEQAGLPKFDAVSISAEVGARKPHLAIFEDICRKLQVDPSDAVFVGDKWSSDMVGAIRAGLTPVWIRNRERPRGLQHLVGEFASLSQFEAYLQPILVQRTSHNGPDHCHYSDQKTS